MVSDFIKYCYDHGWSGTIYNVFVYGTFVIHIVLLLFQCKHYQISRVKAISATVLIFVSAIYFAQVLAWMESGFKYWGSINIVRVLVYFPIICAVVAKLMKMHSIGILTLLTPNVALQQAVGHIGCVFPGCCRGYPCDWGIWNPRTDLYHFPLQWLECIVAFAIMLFIMSYQKKNNYALNGKAYPLFLLLFGSTRFLLEFLRDDRKLFLGMSNLSLHALLMVLVGTVWLMVLDEISQQTLKNKHRH